MKKLVLALLFTLPFTVLLGQNVKVIPASMNSSAKKEAVDEYNPTAPSVKTEAETSTDSKSKKVKCVPGCSGKKQCVKKASSAKNSSPANTEEKTSETSKK